MAVRVQASARGSFLRTRVLGISELNRAFEETATELRTAERPAEMAAGEPIREKWRSFVPVRDGHYRDSIVVGWTGKHGAAVGTAWVPELPRDEQPFIYAKRLEYGDSEITAQPSARPALAAARSEATAEGAEVFRSVIKGKRKVRKPTRP